MNFYLPAVDADRLARETTAKDAEAATIAAEIAKLKEVYSPALTTVMLLCLRGRPPCCVRFNVAWYGLVLIGFPCDPFAFFFVRVQAAFP